MGNSSSASASSKSSRSRGSTVTEIDTNSPSLPQRAGEGAGDTLGQTLIAILQHPAMSAHKTKNPGPKARVSIDRLAFSTFFNVVAISSARQTDLNHST